MKDRSAMRPMVRAMRSLAYRVRKLRAPLDRKLSAAGWSPTEALARRSGVCQVRVDGEPPDRCLFIGIFRSRNINTVERLISHARRSGATVRLWDLDCADPVSLRQWVAGSGPGGRSELLNRLASDTAGIDWLVVSDDDVLLDEEALAIALETCRRGELDLAQPAHTGRSHAACQINRVRAFSLARLTRFVEVGPIFIVSARAIPEVFPLDESEPMGWGIDMRWSLLTDRGFRLAIIDAALMTHLDPPALSYTANGAALAAGVRDGGGIERIMTTIDTWRPWSKQPPWLSDDRMS